MKDFGDMITQSIATYLVKVALIVFLVGGVFVFAMSQLVQWVLS